VSGRDYASVPERITWTTGFRVPIDKHVLGALSTFANFKTGEGARPSISALIARSGLPRSTLRRALQRLEDDHWIVAHRRHRHATTWDICIERLAENWVGAKVVPNLRPTSGPQTASAGTDLRPTGEHLRPTNGPQTVDRRPTSGPPIPCTSDPLYEPSAPALRAGLHAETETTTTTEAKVEVADARSGSGDVWADGGDHPRPGADHSSAGLQQPLGGNQVSARDAGVPVRQQADSPGAVSHQPRGSPQQLTFGPIDATSPEDRRHSHWQRVKEIFQDALKKKSG
jgi:hypothetical protein